MKRFYKFKGTHYKIGQQVGVVYKRWGRRISKIEPWMEKIFPKQLEIYKKYYPEHLDYLTGIASGLEADKDNVYKFFLTIFLPSAWEEKSTNKCSTFAIKSKKGIFVGRNYDWRAIAEQSAKVFQFKFKDKKAFSFTAVSDMGVWETTRHLKPEYFVFIAEDAINEHGLYVGLNGIPAVSQDKHGMNTPHLVQLLAEKCKNVNEAIILLKKIPADRSQTFTVVDKNGDMAIVEKASNKLIRITHSKEFVMVTNHYLHPDLIKHNEQIFKNIPFHSTFARHYYLQLNLSKYKNNMTLDTVKEIMAKAPLMQNWRGIKNGDAVTSWTLVIDLSKGISQLSLAPLTSRPILVNF